MLSEDEVSRAEDEPLTRNDNPSELPFNIKVETNEVQQPLPWRIFHVILTSSAFISPFTLFDSFLSAGYANNSSIASCSTSYAIAQTITISSGTISAVK